MNSIVFSRVALVGVLASIPFALVGCSSTSTRAQMPVPEVWHKLESESSTMRTLSSLTKKDSSADRMLQGEAAKADELQVQAEKAMSGSTPIRALNSMIDEAAQDFVNTLSTNPEIRDSPYQLVLLVDDFSNDSGVQNPALDQALDSVMSRLQRNQRLRELFVFLTTDDDAAQRILNNTSGDWDDFDPFGDGAGNTDVTKYHPDYIYVLDGSMSKWNDASEYLMQINLGINANHPRTRQLKESFEMQRRYYYHPTRGWITEAKNDELREQWLAKKGEN